MDAVVNWLSNHWEGLTALFGLISTWAVGGYQHRLMWRDYRKRHHINGNGSDKEE